MKKETTKEKIVRVAIELFNRDGITNVTLRDIAKAAKLSSGNITYHYKTKQDLVLATYQHLRATFKEIPFLDQMVFQGGMGLVLVQQALEYVVKFRFFFQDTLEVFRQHPIIQELHQEQITYMQKLVNHHIIVGIGKGIMKPEPFDGYYDYLTKSIWMTVDLFIVRQVLLDESPADIPEGVKVVASLLFPNYTEKGRQVYFERLKAAEEAKMA